jgi:hypothetical protein
MKIEQGEQYTMFSVDHILAMSHKAEIEIVAVDGNIVQYAESRTTKTGKLKLGKPMLMNLEDRDMRWIALLPGWGYPITTDFDAMQAHQVSIMRGNAMINLIAVGNVSKNEMREMFDKNVNESFNKTRVLWIKDPRSTDVHGDNEELLYPEAKED